MRRAGELPYHWLADNTRWQRKPDTFDSVEDALRETARFYRKSLWRDADSYVEIWLEKDALSGVIYPITSMFDVPLMVARGYASLSFLHSAAEYINDLDVPTYIYHLGDFDPSGVNAGEKIEETLHELAPDADITFERIAVTPEQITAWALPTRPTKPSDTRSKNFGEISVELDAIEPNQLRALVQEAIERHLPPEQFEVVKAAEASERDIITRLVGKFARKRLRCREARIAMSSLVLKRASAYQFVDTANRPWPTCVAPRGGVSPQASAKIAGTLSAHGSLYASGTLPPL